MHPARKATVLVAGTFAIAALARTSEGVAHERTGRSTAVCVDESVDGLAKDLANEMRSYASASGQATDFATAYSIAPWPPDSITATIAPRLSTDHDRLRFVVDTTRASVEYFLVGN